MATATTSKTAAKATPAATVTESATTLTVSSRPAYFIEKLDEATGELAHVSRFRYLPGHPRQVRFDAKAYIICTGCSCICFFIRCTKHQYFFCFTCTVWQGYCSTDGLISFFRINTEADM